ncbi:hypothetical protein WA026_003699 [Henosepilachna vigintioctopunctata]|uniref:Lariat debranching enzyme C-terminal domain-containing protein n=1 Tax=Henosepilachna vigintioctopunctata TaxID=420089 RepID=A0AAW1U769_9CUCU
MNFVLGVRIAGLSGIYKANDYMKGHFEVFPFDTNTKRSVYHIRNSEVFRLKQISQPIDIMLSHDWPTNVTDYGNKEQLIRFKPHFKEDIETQKLGSKPCEELLSILKPRYWFSSHLHCKFAALVPHENNTFTRFLALDKCLPKRRFLQVIEIPHDEKEEIKINYDLEWLTILVTTNHLTSIKQVPNYMPGLHGNERFSFTPTDEEKSLVMSKLTNDLTIPENFKQTAEPYDEITPKKHLRHIGPIQNPQTVQLCELLSIDDPIEMILKEKGRSFDESYTEFQNEISNTDIKNDASLENPCDATFVNDTITEETTPIKDFKRKLSSLSLPKPKNDVQDLFVIDKDPLTTDNSFEFLNRDHSLFHIDEGDSNKCMKKEIENTQQSSKNKMKRRNTGPYIN